MSGDVFRNFRLALHYALANCIGVRRVASSSRQPVILTGMCRVNVRAFDVESGASRGRDPRPFGCYIAGVRVYDGSLADITARLTSGFGVSSR